MTNRLLQILTYQRRFNRDIRSYWQCYQGAHGQTVMWYEADDMRLMMAIAYLNKRTQRGAK
jgi:hypothetical protein